MIKLIIKTSLSFLTWYFIWQRAKIPFNLIKKLAFKLSIQYKIHQTFWIQLKRSMGRFKAFPLNNVSLSTLTYWRGNSSENSGNHCESNRKRYKVEIKHNTDPLKKHLPFLYFWQHSEVNFNNVIHLTADLRQNAFKETLNSCDTDKWIIVFYADPVPSVNKMGRNGKKSSISVCIYFIDWGLILDVTYIL